jgi:L,D-peptidoglycan transpeptidase YkuD (ErfK/YbiS/YcfS/YnhG family)
MRHGRLRTLLTVLVLLGAGLVGQGGSSAAAAADGWPGSLSLDPAVRQLVTVTSPRWSDTRARLRVWRKRDGDWRLVRGPVRVSLGWGGWVRARDRRQSTGTTPAGRFSMRSAFGTRPDPGTALGYRRVDGNDYWPYEPRDPATYNIYQPHKARATRWRSDYVERLADYGEEYAYSVVLGFNLPGGVHWSPARRQWVARTPADTDRGGGIFLHVKKQRYTAGCVAGPLRAVRWLVRWLDPDLEPRIVMGPTAWVQRRF